jgi:hypothetical protein
MTTICTVTRHTGEQEYTISQICSNEQVARGFIYETVAVAVLMDWGLVTNFYEDDWEGPKGPKWFEIRKYWINYGGQR